MAFYRRDDWVNGWVLNLPVPNCSVAYYTQPGLALATLYNDANGDQTIPNPQYTDGYGHAVAYMAAGEYTIVYSGPQIQTLTLPDQTVGPGGAGSTITAFAGTPSGTIDGVNRVFGLMNGATQLTVLPTQATVAVNYPLVPGVGYTLGISGGLVYITFTNAPQVGDTLYAQGYTIS